MSVSTGDNAEITTQSFQKEGTLDTFELTNNGMRDGDGLNASSRPQIGRRNALALSRRTLRTMKQNLFGAFIYNVVGILVAAGVLFPVTGLLLNPVLASAVMTFSSVSVVSNNLRLRRAEQGVTPRTS